MMNKYSVVGIADRSGALMAAPCARWAFDQFTGMLAAVGCGVQNGAATGAKACDFVIELYGAGDAEAQNRLAAAGLEPPDVKEAYAIVPNASENTQRAQGLAVIAGGAEGLMYALLELADRIKYCDNYYDMLDLMDGEAPVSEKPANAVRGVIRAFSSEVEDKPWFYDRSFWIEYLNELAYSRFNQLDLALGLGIDNGHDPDIRDNYLCFPYPFLLALDKYPDVKAEYLSEDEREENLAIIRFIGAEAKRRSIKFNLSIWTSTYKLVGCEHENYPIRGLDDGNLAEYTRDALPALLAACPDIDSVTLRLHYESGIPEPAHEFWKTVIAGLKDFPRKITIDLHSKGADFDMVQFGLDTGNPVLVTAKYHAEHFALPYHQAAIRPTERIDPENQVTGKWSVTTGARRFTRYGYADYLSDDREYGFYFKIWPGTVRVLQWGDPAMCAGYGRLSSFGGSLGSSIFEPMSFKARKDSGFPGRRDPYADPSLKFDENEEWKKYLYFYRLWGRHMYNPECDPDVYRRFLRRVYGDIAVNCEKMLSYASRILPYVTAAHMPSAANNCFWPEIYTNMPIMPESAPAPFYGDTPSPKLFNNVSPLDPELFYRISDYADDVLSGSRRGKISPYEAADVLETLADQAEYYFPEAEMVADDDSDFRRLLIDAYAQVWLGRFFADKFRAGLEYELFLKTKDKALLKKALDNYKEARAAWVLLIEITRDVYIEDIRFGFSDHMRGNWDNRLPRIDEDIANMERKLELEGKGTKGRKRIPARLAALLKAGALDVSFKHEQSDGFIKGEPLFIKAEATGAAGLRLHYRHVDQSDQYVEAEMAACAAPDANGADGAERKLYEYEIPAGYTDSRFGIIYYFEAYSADGNARNLPGLAETLDNQPYYVLYAK